MGSELQRRVALMGCGRIATKRHAPILADGQIAGAVLDSVCDTDVIRAQVMGERYGVPYYTSIEALMERQDPDVVAILTPSGLHAQHIRQLLPYGKPLIVEKPLALRPTSAEFVTQEAEEAGVPLFTVLQNRFNPPIVHLKRALDAGRLGDPIVANVCVRWCRHADYYKDWHGTWEMAGGVLANQAIHHIDLLQWLLGMPRDVFAWSGSSSVTGTQVEDTLIGMLRFWHNGVKATIETTAATRPRDLEGSITILGTRGSVKVGGFAVNRMEIWDFEELLPGDDEIRVSCETPPDVYGYGHRAFYDHVTDCLDSGAPSPIDGRNSVTLVTALYESVETQKVVDLYQGPPYSLRLGKVLP